MPPPRRLALLRQRLRPLPGGAVVILRPQAGIVQQPVYQRTHLHRFAQRLVIVLTDDLDHGPDTVAQDTGGNRRTVEVGPAAAAPEHLAGDRHLVVTPEETSFHGRLVPFWPDQVGACGLPAEEAKGTEQERLAGTGLAGHHHQTRPRLQAAGGDDPQVVDGELVEHVTARRGGTWS